MLPSPLRSLNRTVSSTVIVAAALSLLGCGPPTVDLPPGNDQVTSDGGQEVELVAPTLQRLPERYPHAQLAVRGVATGASRVLVEGAGNPVVGQVQPIDGTFCVVVELVAVPAQYTLDVRGQGGDGRLSPRTTVTIERARDATIAPDTELCDGSRPGG